LEIIIIYQRVENDIILLKSSTKVEFEVFGKAPQTTLLRRGDAQNASLQYCACDGVELPKCCACHGLKLLKYWACRF